MTAVVIISTITGCAVIMYFLLIAERKKMIRKVRLEAAKSEKKYSNLIENIGVVMYSADIKGQITFTNNEVTALTGYTVDELNGKHFSILLDPAWVEPVSMFYGNQFITQQDTANLQFQIRTKSGKKKWVEQHSKLTLSENRGQGFQCIVKDITAQKLAEEELERSELMRKENEYRLNAILDNTTTIVFIKDLTGRYLMVNRRFREILRRSNEEILYKTDYDLTAPERADIYKRADDEVIATRRHIQSEVLVEAPEGKRNFLLVKFPLLDDKGQVFGISGIATDITENVEAQKQVEEALTNVKEAYELQEQFLANMSHEIQTPLTGVQGMIHFLMTTQLSETQSGFVSSISKSVSSLQGILSNILDFSNLKAGNLLLQQVTIDVHEILMEIKDQFVAEAKEKQLSLTAGVTGNLPPGITGDAFRLKQVLMNIVGNAVKFTHSGNITIEAAIREQSKEKVVLAFTITDTGIGIEEGKSETIFQAFAQGGANISRDYAGTGLGLAISRILVQLQGGEISVKNNVGGGAVFSFSIPYPLSHNTEPATVNLLKGKHFLIVEDNYINQRLIERALQEAGATSDIASNGREAIELLSANRYELIIMDIMMPVMDGIEATRYIRGNMRLSIPIIAVTAAFLKEDEERCREAGVNDFMAKPFDFKELLNRIARLLTGQELHLSAREPVKKDTINELYNLSRLEELEDDEYVAEMITLFLTTTPSDLGELRELSNDGKWKETFQLAHKIKGALGMLQSLPITRLLQEIELDAKTGNPDAKMITKKIEEVFRLFADLEQQLQGELEKLKKQLQPK